MKLTADEADEIVLGNDGWVATEFIESHRWYELELVVFRTEDGELRGFYHERPSTEYQEGGERYSEVPVPTYKVEEVQVTSYRTVKDG